MCIHNLFILEEKEAPRHLILFIWNTVVLLESDSKKIGHFFRTGHLDIFFLYLFESLISFRVGPPRLVQNSKWFFFATDPLLKLNWNY